MTEDVFSMIWKSIVIMLNFNDSFGLLFINKLISQWISSLIEKNINKIIFIS